MKLVVSEAAQAWYAEEMGLTATTGIRFFGKVYGNSPVHENFSLGMEVAEPTQPLVMTEVKGTKFFIEESDEWYFDGYDFYVDYDEQLQEPTYHYEPADGSQAPQAEYSVDTATGPSKKDQN